VVANGYFERSFLDTPFSSSLFSSSFHSPKPTNQQTNPFIYFSSPPYFFCVFLLLLLFPPEPMEEEGPLTPKQESSSGAPTMLGDAGVGDGDAEEKEFDASKWAYKVPFPSFHSDLYSEEKDFPTRWFEIPVCYHSFLSSLLLINPSNNNKQFSLVLLISLFPPFLAVCAIIECESPRETSSCTPFPSRTTSLSAFSA
jgi:hypothetical protein